MNTEEMRRKWQAQSEVAFGELSRWRAEHPQATLAEIEQVIDGQITALRAAMIQEMALGSVAVSGVGSCPQCGQPVQRRGRQRRTLRTPGGQEVTLEREYVSCPHCGAGFFPPGP
jgi:YgiT-type zinc finger domain-containing protein